MCSHNNQSTSCRLDRIAPGERPSPQSSGGHQRGDCLARESSEIPATERRMVRAACSWLRLCRRRPRRPPDNLLSIHASPSLRAGAFAGEQPARRRCRCRPQSTISHRGLGSSSDVFACSGRNRGSPIAVIRDREEINDYVQRSRDDRIEGQPFRLHVDFSRRSHLRSRRATLGRKHRSSSAQRS